MRLFYDWSTQNVLANFAHVETIRLLNKAQLSWFDEEYPSSSSFKSRQRFSALWPVQHMNTIWLKLFHCGSGCVFLVVVLLECKPPPSHKFLQHPTRLPRITLYFPPFIILSTLINSGEILPTQAAVTTMFYSL